MANVPNLTALVPGVAVRVSLEHSTGSESLSGHRWWQRRSKKIYSEVVKPFGEELDIHVTRGNDLFKQVPQKV